MKTIVASVVGLICAIGYAATAWAACPPGTKYDCYQTANGKQSCGCR